MTVPTYGWDFGRAQARLPEGELRTQVYVKSGKRPDAGRPRLYIRSPNGTWTCIACDRDGNVEAVVRGATRAEAHRRLIACLKGLS